MKTRALVYVMMMVCVYGIYWVWAPFFSPAGGQLNTTEFLARLYGGVGIGIIAVMLLMAVLVDVPVRSHTNKNKEEE